MKKVVHFIKYWHDEGRRIKLADAASLTLRLWLGLSMILLHGWGKLQKLLSDPSGFPDPLGIGATLSLSLATWAEFGCSLFIIIGFATRPALTQLITTMAIAFFLVHGAALTGQMSGELAFVYMGGFVTLFVLGPGRISIDHMLLKKW